jgi:PAS domain S-box-containing protein
VPTRSLRARLWLALAASLLTGLVALCLGAEHLVAAQASGAFAADGSARHAIWLTLSLVVLAALAAAIGGAVFSLRALRGGIAPVREALLTLAQHSLPDQPDATLSDEMPAPRDVEFAPLHDAVQQARTQLRAVIRRLHMESVRHQAIVDSVFAGVFAVDGGGRIISANAAAARMFGVPIEALHGVVLSDLIAPDDLRMAVDEFGTVTFTGSAPAQRFTTRIRMFGQPAFSAEVSVTPLAIDGQRAWAVFVHDLTDKERAQAALEDARVAAETASRAKTAFLARMSHELRTPLNSMIGFTKIVRRSRSSQLSERDRHYLDRVQAGSEHLLDLVSDILELSSIESGRIDLALERCDVAPVVRDILSTFEQQVADRPVHLIADLPETAAFATIDTGRMRQLLTNLIGNAVKFTARGSVNVSVKADALSHSAIAVIVRDTGIGIPLERQAQIFESFEQGGEETSHRYGGTGLGLALSRRIAQQMGCTLSVESMPGAGSTFTLSFSQVDARPASAVRSVKSDAA